MNQVYIGNMVHFRTGTQNFKSKKMIWKPEDDWVVVEGTHEALVDAETFWTVQERIKVKQAGKKRSENNIFRGIMFCGECGKRMAFCSRKKDERRKSLGTFSCNANRRYGGKVCTTHYISLEQVKAIVLANIRRHAMLVAEDADAYADYLMSLSQTRAFERTESHEKRIGRSPALPVRTGHADAAHLRG